MYSIEIKNLRKVDKKTIKANLTVVLNSNIIINNCKLVYSEKKERYYVFLPSTPYKDGYFDIVKVSDPLLDNILSAAVEAYKQADKPEIVL